MARDMHQDAPESKGEANSFVMFYTANWFGGTQNLTYEQKGFYVDVLFRMWERKGPLPDDVRWLSFHMGADPRTVRRIRGDLIRLEKLESRDGFLSNRRMMKEIAKVVRRERQVAPAKQLEPEQCSDELPAEISQRSARDQPDLPEIFSKNPMKSMGGPPLTRGKRKEPEREDHQPSSLDAASEQADEDLISDLEKWLPPDRARECLDAMQAEYGRRGVRRGHDRLRQHMARGKPVRDPPGLWLAMCRRMRDEDDGDETAEMAEFKRRSAAARKALDAPMQEAA